MTYSTRRRCLQPTGALTKLPVADQVRLINASARMFDIFQMGCLTLQKLKSGGKQHVVVHNGSRSTFPRAERP